MEKPKVEDPNEPLNQALAALPSAFSSDILSVVALIEVLITRLRKDNDTATHEEVLSNQGGLKELKRLKEYLLLKKS